MLWPTTRKDLIGNAVIELATLVNTKVVLEASSNMNSRFDQVQALLVSGVRIIVLDSKYRPTKSASTQGKMLDMGR